MLKDGYDPQAPAKYRRQLEVICGLVTPAFDVDETPEHTKGRDRKDDFVIETAFQGGGLAIVSEDKKHIALADDDPSTVTRALATRPLPTGRALWSSASSTRPASSSTMSMGPCSSSSSASP